MLPHPAPDPRARKAVQESNPACPNILAKARTLLKGAGSPISLDLRTGKPEPPPTTITAFGIPPNSDPDMAFTSFAGTQNALRRGAAAHV